MFICLVNDIFMKKTVEYYDGKKTEYHLKMVMGTFTI